MTADDDESGDREACNFCGDEHDQRDCEAAGCTVCGEILDNCDCEIDDGSNIV